MLSFLMKSTLPKGKTLSVQPEGPALTCQQCHTVGDGSGTCPNCGISFPSFKARHSELAHGNAASTAEGGPPPTAPSNQASDSFVARFYHPIFWGHGKTLFGIFIVNTLYTLLTLGIYSFWGRVRIREYLSSQTSLRKIRFSYHGTGLELLKGSLKALIVFGIPYSFLSFVPIFWDEIPAWIPNALAGIMVICFIPVAVVGSHRYRFSRTAFGAIRFSFRGQVHAYMKIWLIGTLLTVMTAGAYYPFFENARREFLTSHTYLGNRHFTYSGTGMALLGVYSKTLGLIVGTLLLTTLMLIERSELPLTADFQEHFATWLHDPKSHFWISAGIIVNTGMLIFSWFYVQLSKQRYFWNHSSFGIAPFHYTASTWNLIELRVTNFFMLILTFGLAWSWVQVRNLQFLFFYLGLQGPLDMHKFEQEALDASPTGEELAGYFDAGFDLG